jgi:hypothetical protein
MNMTMIGKRDLTPDERLIRDQEAFVRGMIRFPIVSLTLMRASIQIPDLDAMLLWAQDTPDKEAGGKPYISEIPLYRGSRDRTARYYLTRYKNTLEPLFKPRRVVFAPVGERSPEQQRLIDALDRFPILTPSLLQSALNGGSSQWWKEDMRRLIRVGLVKIWHADLLETGPDTKRGEKVPHLGTWTEKIIKEDVTYRGVRYFLTEYAERLQVFLIR